MLRHTTVWWCQRFRNGTRESGIWVIEAYSYWHAVNDELSNYNWHKWMLMKSRWLRLMKIDSTCLIETKFSWESYYSSYINRHGLACSQIAKPVVDGINISTRPRKTNRCGIETAYNECEIARNASSSFLGHLDLPVHKRRAVNCSCLSRRRHCRRRLATK